MFKKYREASVRIFVNPFVKRCPKSGKIVSFRLSKKTLFCLFPITGLLALMWYCVRVLPKPCRALYPCQQVAAPMASGFLVWITGVLTTVFAFSKSRHFLRKSHILIGSFCAFVGFAALIFTFTKGTPSSYAHSAAIDVSVPVGTAQGIYPGRVVWDYNPSATNEMCDNSDGNYWWQNSNTNQVVVEEMLSKSLKQLTGTTSDSDAWTAIFKYFNAKKRNLPNTGYRSGEKIMIKVNLCSSFGMIPPSQGGSYTKGIYANSGDYRAMPDVSPQMMKAILKSLTVFAGVNQADITLGDPNRPFFDQFFDLIQPSFPEVKYLDPWGTNGRTLNVPTPNDVIFYSNHDASDSANIAVSDKLPQAFVDATYMINIAALKGHELAGVTLCAKNHFGSPCRLNSNKQGSSTLLHYSLPNVSPGYSQYRDLVDLMGHKDIGGKTALYIIDGLWGGFRSIPNQPNRWVSPPFNNHWPSSILMSQDPVAIDAVGFDFLKEEYKSANNYGSDHINPNVFTGVDDYLLQAASAAYWPQTVNGLAFGGYDPENDGTVLSSLGVYDHWNNGIDKQYSKNLNPTLVNGIELIKISNDSIASIILPGVIQVEDYKTGGEGVGYHDLTSGNSGNAYRTDNVDIQATTDVGGGYNIGWNDAGEWLNYDVSVANSGLYNFRARVASEIAGTKSISILVDGDTVVNLLSFTASSGWQSWTDAFAGNIALTAGKHELRILMNTGNFNLNYVEVTNASNLVPIADAGPNQSVNVDALVNLDGSGSSDPDNGPQALTYSWTQISGAAVTLNDSATARPTFTPPVEGTYKFRLTVNDGAAASTDAIVVTVNNYGNYIMLPGIIQAEDYKVGGEGVGYHDLTTGNSGNAYRNDNVDIEATADADGEYNAGWIDAGEWLAYDITVAKSGSYNFRARVASGIAGTKGISIVVDGTTVVNALSFTKSSGWQSWTDAVAGNIALTAGKHELRILMNTGNFNLNYVEVTSASNLAAIANAGTD